MSFEFVDVETAKRARGTRLVISSLVPSPWSEAAKGCLRLANVPVLAVRRGLDVAAIDAWTGIDNVPAVMHEREPVRANWSAIVAFADRMALANGGARLLPDTVVERAKVMGVLDMIAGEEGIGWNARLAMIDAGITSNGERGFPVPVAKFLARRYGHTPDAVEAARQRITGQLAVLADELQRAGDYFGGSAPSAIDVYTATFLTPVAAPISEAECPNLAPMFRAAFAAAHDAFGALIDPALLAHRERMFTHHLQRPIEI